MEYAWSQTLTLITTVSIVIWAFSTRDSHILGHYLGGQTFTSVALSADGHTLYAVSPGHGIVLIDVTSGQAEQTIRGLAQSPWGIAWVNH